MGWNSTIGRWARTDESKLEIDRDGFQDIDGYRTCLWLTSVISFTPSATVLGDDVNLKDECYITGCSVLPHKSVSVSLYEPQIVM